jgi:hypothetical protein
MPATYSINVGQIIEATRKPDIFTVLQELPDNTQKLISPRDVRDAFLSSWANSAFKITNPGVTSDEYIGIDSGNPDDRDVKNKILIGKRSYGNLDIMNNTLLNNSNADIFLYNTKSDASDQSSTKIALLAGTSSALHIYAPYIEAYATASVIDLNIQNPSLYGGAINIYSQTGRVAISGIAFPTVAETTASASNGKILRYSGTYPNGVLKWDDATLTLTDIGTLLTPTNIYGSNVYINGYSMEFVEDDLVPQTIGGVTAGSSFGTGSFNGQDWPLSEVIRKILYPYIEPVLDLSISSLSTGTIYADRGTTTSFVFTYSITTYAREDSEDISDFLIKETSQTFPNFVYFGASFSEVPSTSTSSSFTYVTYSSTESTLDFNLAVSNVVGATGFSYPTGYSFSATASINFINPIFYGFSNTVISNSSTLETVSLLLDKLIKPYPGASQSYNADYSGSGYLYFIYPAAYSTDLSLIKDANGFVIHDDTNWLYSAFTSSSVPFPMSSQYSLSNYMVYRTIATCSYTGAGEFEFIF